MLPLEMTKALIFILLNTSFGVPEINRLKCYNIIHLCVHGASDSYSAYYLLFGL
jgi:hypothetical protein